MSRKSESLFSGPWFDLSLELGPAGDNEKVARALSAIWSCSSIRGPWKKDTEIGADELLIAAGDGDSHAYGLLSLGDAEPLPFVVNLVSENQVDIADHLPSGETITLFGNQSKECSDWLNISIPFNALSQKYSFKQTFELGAEPWVLEMCLLLVQIADAVHQAAGIECGVLGEEVSGCWRKPSAARLLESDQGVGYTAVLDAAILKERGGFIVSPLLWEALKPEIAARVMPGGLIYVPIADGAFLNADGPKNL